MNIEFSQQDFAKLDELIQATPFKYSYPLFLFFQGKVKEANEKLSSKIKEEQESDGD